jgi:alanine racemase
LESKRQGDGTTVTTDVPVFALSSIFVNNLNNFGTILWNLESRMQRRPCWVEISTRALEENYRLLSAASSVELLAIVKADAYGHGLALCAPAAVRAGARWLGVTSVEEGVAARVLCPDAEILVISGPFRGQGGAVVAHRLTPVVWEPWQLGELAAAARAAGIEQGALSVHLELDTGMSRQGVSRANLVRVLSCFSAGSPLRIDGLMTHLYAADESDGESTREQLALLKDMAGQVLEAGHRPAWLHAGNSASVLGGDVPLVLQTLCAQSGLKVMARPGLALYGSVPEFAPDEPVAVRGLRVGLRPVLTWKTQIVSVREIAAGQVVGYNGTFVATEPMRVALLAVGYADGLSRALSNRGSVLVRGQRAPIVGRISMDQTVVDVTEMPDAAPGDDVVLLGRQGSGDISAEDHARWAGTIPWEVFTSIAARVERVAV